VLLVHPMTQVRAAFSGLVGSVTQGVISAVARCPSLIPRRSPLPDAVTTKNLPGRDGTNPSADLLGAAVALHTAGFATFRHAIARNDDEATRLNAAKAVLASIWANAEFTMFLLGDPEAFSYLLVTFALVVDQQLAKDNDDAVAATIRSIGFSKLFPESAVTA